MPGLVASPHRATLPNCDCCGRFTARPTLIITSWSGGAGMRVCSELLLCPHCANNCKTTLTRQGDPND